jgi:hypothetical protein
LTYFFINFSLSIAVSISFKPVARLEHHGGRVWQKKVAYLMAAIIQKEPEKKGPGTRYTLPGHTQVIHFLQPGST